MKDNKNIKIVTVRSDRKCYHCNSNIPKGSKCLTINTYRVGRRWLCSDCKSILEERCRLEAELDSVSFGDEGLSLIHISEPTRP